MSAPNTRDTSVIGIATESTEGTYTAPTGTTSYFQPLESAFDITPSRELLEREVMTNSVGRATPKLGTKSAQGNFSSEFRASGTEGGDVDFSLLLKGALGATRSISTTTTTKGSGNTGSVLQIEDADISKFAVGDIVIIKQSSGHHPCAITAVDTSSGTANITVTPAKASGSFSNSVVISKSTMYYTANSGHPALSVSCYWANQVRQALIGAKVTSMGIDNFSTGQLAAFNFGLESLSYSETDGAAPHTPAYDTGTPPIILNAVIYKDGTAFEVNNFSLSLENELGFQTSTSSSNGRVASRVTKRTISGSVNPYMDDTTTTWFDLFDAGTSFALFIKAFTPSSTSGEITMGSCVGIYLPNCVVTEFKHGDAEGLITDEVSFSADRGANGTSEEMYIGFI